jgi:DNA-binding response OmpR family regulator
MNTDTHNPAGFDQSEPVILLIDDDPNTLDILSGYLEECHYTVLIAEDGESGLKRADYARPDLILLDIMMPEMDGFETCRRLKEMESTRDIPVIFMTALADTGHKVRGFEAGAVDYVTKPIQREEVVARAGVHLRIRELATRLRGANESLEQRVEERTAELRRLNRKLLAISDCNQALMRAENEQALLGDICRIICDEAGYSLVWVGFAENDDARTVRPVAWAGVDDGYLADANITWADTERGRGPSGSAIRTGEAGCIQDFAVDPRAAPWRDSALQRGYRSSIALPLKDESAHIFGVLNIYSIEPNAFTPDEIRLLEELSGDLEYGIMVLRNRAERKRAKEALRQIEWMLSRKPSSPEGQTDSADGQGYGDLTALNRGGLIARSIDKRVLRGIAGEYLDLLDTSSAIYEINGDYAFGIFSSRWCRLMDRASRRLCHTDDNSAALASGRWLCHESCWTCCSRLAIDTRAPVDIECNGGIRLYSVPILAGEEVIGAINFGYGDPPRDPEKLRALAGSYALDIEELIREAGDYNTRPAFIIEMAKQRLQVSARLIGILVERNRAEEALQQLNEELEQRVRERTKELERRNHELEQMNKAFVGRELKMVELKERVAELEGRSPQAPSPGGTR